MKRNIILTSYSKISIDGNNLWYKGNNKTKKELINNLILFRDDKSLENKYKKIKNFLRNQNEQFSCVIEFGDSIILFSDIIRTYPVFYTYINDECYVADEINKIPRSNTDEKNMSSFIMSGYVYGNQTIFSSVYAVQAAEIVSIDLSVKSYYSKRYFKFKPYEVIRPLRMNEFVSSFNKKMNNTFKTMLENKQNVNNWIVPLSGGHDSRQIINSLYKLGVKNVICFTYGKPNNHQAKISMQVAKVASYPWYFIEYTEEKWKKLHDLGLIDEYIDFAFNGVSTPHLQDFLAVYELKEKRIIGDGDVFIPGHTLDMISGGHFTDKDLDCKTKEDALIRVGKRHSKLNDERWLKNSTFYDTLSRIFDKVKLEPSNFQEYFNWQERQAKFIVNSCRTYEFFGFDFRLPFWDRELVDFFLQLPEEQRKERKFFKEMERKGILITELATIPFEDEVNVKTNKLSTVDRLKRMIPANLRSILVRSFGKKSYEAEALNQIYALRAQTVEGLLEPIETYPKEVYGFLKPLYKRPTHRVNYHLLSGLYAINCQLKRQKIY